MKLTVVILIALGIVAAVCAVMLTNLLPGMIAGTKTATNQIPVLVAKRTIPAHSELTKDDIEISTLDISQESGYYANPESYLSDMINAVGKTVSSAITEGQAITKDKIITDPDRATILKALKPGMRAYPVRLTGDQIIGGLLEPGSFVDVLGLFRSKGKAEAVSMPVLEKVKVIAIKGELAGHNPDQKGKTSGSGSSGRGGWTVTLLVNTKQAEHLQLVTEKASIALILRNPLDDEVIPKGGTGLDSEQIDAYSDFFDTTPEVNDATGSPKPAHRIRSKAQVEVIKAGQTSYQDVRTPETQE